MTASPLGGGSPLITSCTTPLCTVTGLTPATSYSIAAVGTTAGGGTSPGSPSVTLSTPAAGAPEVSVVPTGATSLTATVTPSAGATGPYSLTATPVSGGAPLTVACPTTACTLTGLAPGTTYSVTATATDGAGGATPASAPVSVSTPPAG